MTKDTRKDPKSWESYTKHLVRLRVGANNFVDMPDKHHGDYGVECYSLTGIAYQSYLPEQDSDVSKLRTAIRKKINADTKKLTETYVVQLSKLFESLPSGQISRWVLLTPYYYSSSLATYCSQKSLEIRRLGLSFISDDFQIIINTEEDFRREAIALAKESFELELSFEENSLDDAANWLLSEEDFLKKMNLKIPKFTQQNKVQETRLFLIQKYLNYGNLMDVLSRDWSEIHEIVRRAISSREDSLIRHFILNAAPIPNEILKNELEFLAKDIKTKVNGFKENDLETITWGVVTDWLIRCPLDF